MTHWIKSPSNLTHGIWNRVSDFIELHVALSNISIPYPPSALHEFLCVKPEWNPTIPSDITFLTFWHFARNSTISVYADDRWLFHLPNPKWRGKSHRDETSFSPLLPCIFMRGKEMPRGNVSRKTCFTLRYVRYLNNNGKYQKTKKIYEKKGAAEGGSLPSSYRKQFSVFWSLIFRFLLAEYHIYIYIRSGAYVNWRLAGKWFSLA